MLKSLMLFILFVCFFSTPAQEQLIVMWLSWMIKEEEYFERSADCGPAMVSFSSCAIDQVRSRMAKSLEHITS